MARMRLHSDAAYGSFSSASVLCVMVSGRMAVPFISAESFSHLGTDRNITTRDRQFEHGLSKILCFGAAFPLTEFSHLFTLRRQIRGERNSASGQFLYPGNAAPSFDAICRISSKTSRRRPSTPRRRRSQRCRRGVTQVRRRACGYGDALEGFFSFSVPVNIRRSNRVQQLPAENQATACSRFHSGVKYKGSLARGSPPARRQEWHIRK